MIGPAGGGLLGMGLCSAMAFLGEKASNQE